MCATARVIVQDHDVPSARSAMVDWRSRYEGILVVAYLDGKAVAGISGPWPVNKFALTWWDRPVPARQLELFDSLEAAQQRVEEWARRMRTIGLMGRMPANDPVHTPVEKSTPRPSWLDRVAHLFDRKPHDRPAPAPRQEPYLEMPVVNTSFDDDTLHGVHFAAYE